MKDISGNSQDQNAGAAQLLPRLVLFTRYPTPGECKTRLASEVGAAGAASIHRQLTERTVEVLRQNDCATTIAFTGAPKGDFQSWLGVDINYTQQASGDLSDRLIALLQPTPVIFFGSDTPDLNSDHVAKAIAALRDHRVVIGPAVDGGYYLIGLRDPLPQLFVDMPWSTSEVLAETMNRLDQLGIEPLLLESLHDCDRPDDLLRWPQLQP